MINAYFTSQIRQRQMEWLAAGHMGFYVRHLAAPVHNCLTKSSELLLEKYAQRLVLRGTTGSVRAKSGATGKVRVPVTLLPSFKKIRPIVVRCSLNVFA